MKKSILFFLPVLFFSFSLSGQKIYATKTGQLQFDASSPLEKIMAINNQVDSKFNPANGQIVLSALVQSFRFENQLMEDHFNENYMESSKFPKADFKGYLSDISKIDFTKNGEYPVAADGTLTIHGQSNKVVVNGILTVQADGVTLKGQFTIQIKDFGIRGSYIGDKIASQVNIRVNCQYK